MELYDEIPLDIQGVLPMAFYLHPLLCTESPSSAATVFGKPAVSAKYASIMGDVTFTVLRPTKVLVPRYVDYLICCTK